MKSSTKKIIAREFLFLLGLFALTALVWLGIIIYNYSLQAKIERVENELVVEEQKLDSLISHQNAYIELSNFQKVYSRLVRDNYELPNFNTFQRTLKDDAELVKLYNQIKDSYDLPDFATFKKDMTSKQRYRVYPLVSEHVLNELAVTIIEKPSLTESELFHKFPEIENDTDAIRLAKEYTDVLVRNPNMLTNELSIIFPQFFLFSPTYKDLPQVKKINNQLGIIKKQQTVIAEMKGKNHNLSLPLTNDDIKELLIKIFLYGLIIAFGGRYLYIATKWAIKTVKE